MFSTMLFIVAMANSIKLFQGVQQCYHTMGIIESPRTKRIYSINVQFLFFSLSITLIFISITLFFFFEAISITSYGRAFFISTANMFVLFDFLITCQQMSIILNFIEMSEKFIEKSKMTN